MTAETSNARGDAEYEYEVWQGDALQAGGSTTDYASAQSEAGHYAMMYASGGPVEVRIYEKRLLNAAPPPAAAEPKTLPVPTRVYLTDKAAVIVGDPQRGWDEEGPDAHNCDDMGCATIGPHVLARVPFTDERVMSRPAEGVQAGEVSAYDLAVLDDAAETLDRIGEGSAGLREARARIASALSQQPEARGGGKVEDGPIDASDNAEYIEHCADRLERCGLRVTAGALRVIAHEHRTLAQQPAADGGMAELVGMLDEVRSHFTRDDDLPDDLLPRIDAALAAQQGDSHD